VALCWITFQLANTGRGFYFTFSYFDFFFSTAITKTNISKRGTFYSKILHYLIEFPTGIAHTSKKFFSSFLKFFCILTSNWRIWMVQIIYKLILNLVNCGHIIEQFFFNTTISNRNLTNTISLSNSIM
jgi:hypothetical protein